MNREEQIAEMAKIICGRVEDDICIIDRTLCDSCCNWARQTEKIYNAGYRKTFTSDLISDTQKAFKKGYEKGCETCAQAWANGYNYGYESGKEDGVKEFAEKVKEEVYPFLQAEMYNKKHFITGDSVSDKLLENQNIGILKAQDVLSKWFKVKIDELLKEYE